MKSNMSEVREENAGFEPRHNILTVMQVDPLVYWDPDRDGGKFCPVPDGLDFERETKMLPDVDQVFKTGTTTQLTNFFVCKKSRVLHLSSHGTEGYLVLESDRIWNDYGEKRGYQGARCYLHVNDLKDLINPKQNDKSLLEKKVVFLATCHGEEVADAFVQAGVGHVVCSRQEDMLDDEGTMAFARVFYRCLVEGNTIEDSFSQAKENLKHTNGGEKKKYLLLPEKADDDPYHKVQVFDTKHAGRKRQRNTGRNLPSNPEFFLGRNLDMYKLNEQLDKRKLIWITGKRGVGKYGLAVAWCNYVNKRRDTFLIEDVIWIPSVYEDNDVFFEKCRNDTLEVVQNHGGPHDYLIAIDGRKFNSEGRLITFLKQLLCIQKVKVVVVYPSVPPDPEGKTMGHDFCVKPLDLVSSVTLFGKLCPHVSQLDNKYNTGKKFADFLVPNGENHLPDRTRDIFGRVLEGNPDKVRETAKNMTKEECGALMVFSLFDTRVELESEITKQKAALSRAGKQNLSQVNSLEEDIKELERHLDSFPTLEQLKSEKSDLDKKPNTFENFMKKDNLDKQIRKEELKCKLVPGQTFTTPKGFKVVISCGSVLNFSDGQKKKSAIVVPTNDALDPVRCDKGGVDSFVAKVGGEKLEKRIRKLPKLRRYSFAKCPIGDAVIVGTDPFSELNSNYLIYAVGPCFNDADESKENDFYKDLRLAYQQSLKRAKEGKIEAVAFALISAGNHRGSQPLDKVLQTGMEEICNFDGYNELEEIHVCAYTPEEDEILSKIDLQKLSERRIEKYHIHSEKSNCEFSFVIASDSVLTFSPGSEKRSAIVCPGNTTCLPKHGIPGGLDKFIVDAGGEDLKRDTESLRVDDWDERCPEGDAVITGPGSYGKLNVNYVIHAVGPSFKNPNRWNIDDRILRSTYKNTLERAKEEKLEVVAFAPLSAGNHCESRPLEDVLRIGMEEIISFDGYNELNEIRIYGYRKDEADILFELAKNLKLEAQDE